MILLPQIMPWPFCPCCVAPLDDSGEGEELSLKEGEIEAVNCHNCSTDYTIKRAKQGYLTYIKEPTDHPKGYIGFE